MVEEVLKYAVILVILTIILNILAKIFAYCKDFIDDKRDEYRIRQHAKEYIKKKSQEEKIVANKYFGLFEFVLENSNDEKSLKQDYCSVIKDKIKSKYKNVFSQFSSTDRIFFCSNDFSMLDNIINDFIKLYKFFADMNQKRHITTNLKFSIWTKPGNISTQRAYNILNELNNLNYVNQVIANDEIYKEYQRRNLIKFNFHPYGAIKLNDSDEDMEIYRLIKK